MITLRDLLQVFVGAQALGEHLEPKEVTRIANLALVDCNKSGDHAGAVVASRHIRQASCTGGQA